jgi:hypothetical protein
VGQDEHPDHCVVIKYVPYVGDSKRAMDEYVSEIFMGGTNTIIMHNTCEVRERERGGGGGEKKEGGERERMGVYSVYVDREIEEEKGEGFLGGEDERCHMRRRIHVI